MLDQGAIRSPGVGNLKKIISRAHLESKEEKSAYISPRLLICHVIGARSRGCSVTDIQFELLYLDL